MSFGKLKISSSPNHGGQHLQSILRLFALGKDSSDRSPLFLKPTLADISSQHLPTSAADV